MRVRLFDRILGSLLRLLVLAVVSIAIGLGVLLLCGLVSFIIMVISGII